MEGWFGGVWPGEIVQFVFILAGLIFGLVWAWEGVLVYRGGAALSRRLEGLRGDVFAVYKARLLAALDGFARWLGDGGQAPDRDYTRPNHFSASSYLFVLGAAVFYPFVFLSLSWALADGPGTIGTARLFPGDGTWLQKSLVLGAYIVPISVYALVRVGFNWRHEIALLISYAVAGAVAFTGTGAVAVAFAFAFAVAHWALRSDQRRSGRWWFVSVIAAIAFLPALSLAYVDGSVAWIDLSNPAPEALERFGDDAQTAMPLVLFFCLLPALNAPADWLSLAVSRTLLRWTAAPPWPARWVLGGFHWFESLPLGWLAERLYELAVIAVDVFLAVLFACLIVFLTAFGFALFNYLHIAGGGAGIGFLVSERISEMRADPANPEFWWLYAMMFWTLVPTIVHIFAFAGALTASALSAGNVGSRLARRVEGWSGHFSRSLVAGFELTVWRLAPGLFLLFVAFFEVHWVINVVGLPFELVGDLGVSLPCTDEFSAETLGTCLADGSTAIALWFEARH